MNKHAGTHRLPGGGLAETAGRIPELDELAKRLVEAKGGSERDAIYSDLADIIAKTPSKYIVK